MKTFLFYWRMADASEKGDLVVGALALAVMAVILVDLVWGFRV